MGLFLNSKNKWFIFSFMFLIILGCDVDTKSCTNYVHSSRIIENRTGSDQVIRIQVSRDYEVAEKELEVEAWSQAPEVNFITYVHTMEPSGKVLPQANCAHNQYLARVELLDSDSNNIKLCYQVPPPYKGEGGHFEERKWEKRLDNNKVYIVGLSDGCPSGSTEEQNTY